MIILLKIEYNHKISEMIDDVDLNQNGQVEFNEFLVLMSKKQDYDKFS